MDADHSSRLADAVREATAAATTLDIVGGGSKAFYGRAARGSRPLAVGGHRGIVSYQPGELVLTARCGTPLAEIDEALAAKGQWLAAELPHFGPAATLGGAVACGLSGPARPYLGALRDFVLGVRLINGRGEILRFGGEVMKNVAGYDISRLATGSLGTLGVILEVSLKVLPRPTATATLRLTQDADAAIGLCNTLAGKPHPLTAAAWLDGQLYLRLAGARTAVEASRAVIGGEVVDGGEADSLWADLREQRLPFFSGDLPLWRLSLPPTSAPLTLPGTQLIDWGGAQHWLRSAAPADAVREAATRAGGHATLFRHGARDGAVFQPLPVGLARLHAAIKRQFDPAGVFNPGRFYPEF